MLHQRSSAVVIETTQKAKRFNAIATIVYHSKENTQTFLTTRGRSEPHDKLYLKQTVPFSALHASETMSNRFERTRNFPLPRVPRGSPRAGDALRTHMTVAPSRCALPAQPQGSMSTPIITTPGPTTVVRCPHTRKLVWRFSPPHPVPPPPSPPPRRDLRGGGPHPPVLRGLPPFPGA